MGAEDTITRIPDGHAQHAYVGMQWAFLSGLMVVGGFLTGSLVGVTLALVPLGLVGLPLALWRMTAPAPEAAWRPGWRMLARVLTVAITALGTLTAIGIGVAELGTGLERPALLDLAAQVMRVAGGPATALLTLALALHVRYLVKPGHPLRAGWPLAIALLGGPLTLIWFSSVSPRTSFSTASLAFGAASLSVTSVWMLLRSGQARAALRSLSPEPRGPPYELWLALADRLELAVQHHGWGLSMSGRGVDGLLTRLSLETCIAPVRLVVEIPVPALGATERGRAIWIRRRTGQHASSFDDPVLDGALVGGGEGMAELVEGLHATLLEALHGHPAELVDGCVRLDLPFEDRDRYLEPRGMQLAPRLDALAEAVQAMRRLAGILQVSASAH